MPVIPPRDYVENPSEKSSLNVQPETPVTPMAKEASRSWRGIAFLVLVCLLVAYGIYVFQIKPLLSMHLPEHKPLPADAVPTELTSFQVREAGKLLTPQSIA